MPLIITDEILRQVDDMARKQNQKLWHIRDAIMTIRNVAWMQREIESSGDNWRMAKPHEWILEKDGELRAEVFPNQEQNGYTAVIWQSGDEADCGNFEDGYLAMLWIGKRLKRAAALNAQVDLAMDGEDSDDFDHKQYLSEMADAKDDHDYSLSF